MQAPDPPHPKRPRDSDDDTCPRRKAGPGPPDWWSDDVERLSKMLPLHPSDGPGQSEDLCRSWVHSSRTPPASHGYTLIDKDDSHDRDGGEPTTLTLARKIRIRPRAYVRQRFQRAFDMCDRAWNYAHDALTEMGWFGRDVNATMAKWLANQIVTKDKKGVRITSCNPAAKSEKPGKAAKRQTTKQAYEQRGWSVGINPRFAIDPAFFDSSVCPSELKRTAVQKFCDAINSTLALRRANLLEATTRTGAPRAKRTRPDVEIPTDRLVVDKRTPGDSSDRSFHIDVVGASKKKNKPGTCLHWDSTGFRFAPTWLQRPEARVKRAEDRHMDAIPPFSKRGLTLPNGRRVCRELHRLTESMGGLRHCPRQATVKYERPGRYYVVVPFEANIAPPRQREPQRPLKVIALDPGVRTFQHGFDLLGRHIEIGKDAPHRPTKSNKRGVDGGTGRILARLKRIDRELSKADQSASVRKATPRPPPPMARDRKGKGKRDAESKRRRWTGRRKAQRAERRHRRKAHRMANRARNWVGDAHRKAAKWLTEEYDDVLVPYSRVSGMVKRRHDRALTRDSVRQMLGWNHYAFRMRLVHKGGVNGCRVHQVSEHYTSKTCSVCGRFWHGLGGSKVFRCQYADCGMVCDRDANGARNILQMNVTRCLGDGGRLVPLAA